MERRNVTGFTIDSEQTRDIDDALTIEFRADGFCHVVVSIADVAESIPAGSKYDERAREMVTTKYFSTGNSPMLPRLYAEDHLSLWPGKERKTITIDMSLGTDTVDVVKTEIYPSVLKSRGRITYDQVPEILKDKTHAANALLEVGTKLAMRILDARRKAGAMVLYDLNNGWVSTEEGFLRKLEKKEETIGYILIQEMMVLANAKVAEFCVKADIPVLYRNHMAMSAMPDRAIIMGQIQDAIATPFADLETVRQRTHMLLGRASYSDSLLGHYGLNLPAYLHFTSPIRRYADLVTHRQVKAHLEGKPLPYTKEEVAAISLHINDVIELEREKASVHFKNKDEEKAKRNIDARRLDGLDAVHFERVTKVEVRAGFDPSDAFEESYLRRLKENRLPLICLTVILSQEGAMEGWKPLRQATIDQLAKKPEDAISVLTQATQIADWAETKFTVKHEGPDHARTFYATAIMPFRTVGVSGNIRTEDVTGTGVGNTSKLAKAHAAIDLLARLGGQTVPEKIHKSPSPKPSLVAAPQTLPAFKEMLSGKDPVSALMEYVAKSKTAAPDFSFTQSGPSHIPTITCTCKLGETIKTATAPNKADAKKQAAKAVLDAILSV